MEEQQTYVVNIVFKNPTKLPYDDTIREDICYVNVIDYEMKYCIKKDVNSPIYLQIKFVDDDVIYLSQSNISSFQVSINKESNEEISEIEKN